MSIYFRHFLSPCFRCFAAFSADFSFLRLLPDYCRAMFSLYISPLLRYFFADFRLRCFHAVAIAMLPFHAAFFHVCRFSMPPLPAAYAFVSLDAALS